MKYRLPIVLSLMLLLSQAGFAQEVIVDDSERPEAFSGTLSYTVSLRPGRDLPDLKGIALPDSACLYVQWPKVRLAYFGGESDSLMNAMQWNAEDGEFYVIHPADERYYSERESFQFPKPKVSKLGGRTNFQEIPCAKFQVTYAGTGTKDEVWASDSIFFPKSEADTALYYLPVFLHPDIPGIPLQFKRTESQGVTVLSLSGIRPGEVPVGAFDIPKGYGYRVLSPRGKDRFPILPQPD